MTTPVRRATLLIDLDLALGECPRWDHRDQSLWFIDISKCTLYRYDWHTRTLDQRTFKEEIGAFAFRESGGLILAMSSGWFRVDDPFSDTPELLINPEADRPWQRFNDGRTCPHGFFYTGTVNPRKDAASAGLYRLDTIDNYSHIASGFMTFNGLVFDEESHRVLYADTPSHAVSIADWDPTGTISNARVHHQFEHGHGRPDGAALDADGFTWHALYDGSRVVRLAPDGTLDHTIHVPALRPTAVCFAGPELDQLIITSAGQNLTDAQRKHHPNSGAVFSMVVETNGVNEALAKI